MAEAGGSTPGGSNLQIQYNNGGSFGGLTDVQGTARIQAATSSLSGALPAWPNNTTTFFRGDGTYQSFTALQPLAALHLLLELLLHSPPLMLLAQPSACRLTFVGSSIRLR